MNPGNLIHLLAACVLTLSLAGGSTVTAGSEAARADGPDAIDAAADATRTAAPADPTRAAPRVTRDAPRTAAPDTAPTGGPDARTGAPDAGRTAPRVARDGERPPLPGAASQARNEAKSDAPLRRRPHGQLTVPVKRGTFRVSQPFHRWHGGIDLAAATGTPVLAVAQGRVVKVRTWLHSYGHHVVVRHAGGRSMSAHLSSIRVREGQRVRPGQVIGRVGSTGNSTGPHLHFVLTKRGRTVDPAGYIWG